VAAPEPILIGWQNLKLQGTCQRVNACPATYLILKPVCKVPNLQVTDRFIRTVHVEKKDEVTFLSNPEPGHIVLGRDLRQSIHKMIDRCLAGDNVPLFTRAWAAVGMATPMHHAQTARENLKFLK
jgi:hypothetical protein